MTIDLASESILDEKFRASYKQLAEERRQSFITGNFEAIALFVLIVTAALLLRYAFWGAGFSEFSAKQHQTSVDMLQNMSGPHQGLLEADLSDKGYISLASYKKYLEMARLEKARQIKAKPVAEAGSVIVDRTLDVNRSVYTSEAEALKSLAQQGLVKGSSDASVSNDGEQRGTDEPQDPATDL